MRIIIVDDGCPAGEFVIVLPFIVPVLLGVLNAALVFYGVKALEALVPALRASFAKVKIRPKYKTYNEIHHIVAQTSRYAIDTRNILKDVGISVNDGINLVSIKTGLHRRLHTKLY